MNRRFHRTRQLGAGSSGDVWLATDKLWSSQVALKEITVSKHSIEELKQEFRNISAVEHHNLLTVYDLYVGDDDAFFTMELLDGKTLTTNTKLAPTQISTLWNSLFTALGALHQRGIVHGDIKPENLIQEAHRVVLIDFGLAGLLNKHTYGGTAPYFSPERCAGAPASAASDVYALGVCLFELATGEPWKSPGWPPDFSDLPLPAPLKRALNQAVSFDAKERPLPPPQQFVDVPFVGRTEEIQWLAQHLNQGQDARLSGPSGFGKTALITQAVPKRTLRGTCSPAEVVSYNGFDTMIMDVSRRLKEVGISAPAPLCAAFPVLGPHLGEAVEREELADCLCALLQQLQVPALWFDDVQWHDQDSLLLLKAMLQRQQRPAIILSHRPLKADHPLTTQPLLTALPHLSLSPLKQTEVNKLTSELTHNQRQMVWHTSQGVPLLIARALRNLKPNTPLLSLKETLLNDLKALTPSALQVLHLVAAHERALPVEVISIAITDPRLARAVAHLVRGLGLLSFQDSQQIAFSHDALREVVQEQLKPHHHREVARAFMSSSLDDPESIAYHFLAAGDTERGVKAARVAATRAEQTRAWGAAARWLKAVVRHNLTEPVHTKRRLAEALAASGKNQECADLLFEIGADRDLHRAAELLIGSGDFSRGEVLWEQALARRNFTPPKTKFTALLRGLWWQFRCYFLPYRGEATAEDVDALWLATGCLSQHAPERCFAFQGQHLAYAKKLGDPQRYGRALVLQTAYADPFFLEHRVVQEMEEEMAAFTDPELVAYRDTIAAYRAFNRTEFQKCYQACLAAEKIYSASGTTRWERKLGWVYTCLSLVHMGRFSEAEEATALITRRLTDADDPITIALLEIGVGYKLALMRDDVAEAKKVLKHATARLSRPWPEMYHFLVPVAYANLARYEGKPEQARAHIDEAWPHTASLRLFPMPHAQLHFHRAAAYAADGDNRYLKKTIQILRKNAYPLSVVLADELQLYTATNSERHALAPRAAERALCYQQPDHEAMFRSCCRDAKPRALREALKKRGIVAPTKWLKMYGPPVLEGL